jgi:hypothetical protein
MSSEQALQQRGLGYGCLYLRPWLTAGWRQGHSMGHRQSTCCGSCQQLSRRHHSRSLPVPCSGCW